MLSILIPTYNYNVYPLVKSLYQQVNAIKIPFEIIVLDDASANSKTVAKNKEINNLENCSYTVLPTNIGRSAIRNLLAEKAQFNWLLFLDADTMPVNDSLISQYLPHLDEKEKVVYGGIKYQEQRPEKDKILRWVYGNMREALPADKRNEAPHLSLLTLNFAIKKSVFEKVRFNENIPNLRHEDTLFSFNLQEKDIFVEHIENPVYHLGLESSEIFLKKSEESVVGLKHLIDNKLLPHDYIRLSKTYISLKKNGMIYFIRLYFWMYRKLLRKMLLTNSPSLFAFDLYRLGYLCSLK